MAILQAELKEFGEAINSRICRLENRTVSHRQPIKDKTKKALSYKALLRLTLGTKMKSCSLVSLLLKL